MFGLSDEQWRDLVLSVNVHRKKRRLSPYQVAHFMKLALRETDVDGLAEALGFTDTTTMRKILRLNDLSDDLASTVDWGNSRGSVSMSTGAELLRLPTAELVDQAIRAAVENGLTKEEARQVVQIFERSGQGLAECIVRALKTRPRVERSELIIGSLLSESAQRVAAELGNEESTHKLKLALAKRYPDVLCRATRINGDKFSLLLDEAEAGKLRQKLGGQSVESMVTEVTECFATGS